MENPGQTLRSGDVIQDTYEVERLLGCGGMGCTYKGSNRANGHAVAIKVVSAELAGSDRIVQLFKRESNLLRTVQNDAVVRYETTIQDKHGNLYLILEFVEGQSLAHYVKRGARLPSDGVLALGERLAGGLAAIHKLGIVHRDVAPDNVMVPDDDVRGAKLIDFGLASDTVGTEKSIVGDSFAGKINYCAPEQLGLFDGRVTAATDVYALGLVLMRVAGLPVPGEGKGFAGALDARRADVAVAGDGITPTLAKTLEAMLRADPADRPSDLAALFRAALEGTAVEAQPSEPEPEPSPAPTALRRLRVMVAAAAVILLLLAAGGWYFWPGGTGPTAGDRPPSSLTAELAGELMRADDPLQEAVDLVELGDPESLNAALGLLMRLGGDEDRPGDVRQRALVMVAEMYDPATHDPARSPFAEPNPSAAARYYARAADLGSADARAALTRLGD